MIKARIYRGIEFIRISELPEDQKESIKKWASQGVIIKILMDTQLLSDCVQYKDYAHWFENFFSIETKEEEVPKMQRSGKPQIKLALGNR